MDKVEFGLYLKELREKKGYSQRKLGRLADVSNTEISKIEAGLREDVSIEILNRIAPALDVSIITLLEKMGYIKTEEFRVGDRKVDFLLEKEDDLVVVEEKWGKVNTIINTDPELLEIAAKVAQGLSHADRDSVKKFANYLLMKGDKPKGEQ